MKHDISVSARNAAVRAYGRAYRVAGRGRRPPPSDPVLFIAGMAKAGTTWLAQLLCEVPGYRSRPIVDPDRCIESHDICDAVFESLRPFPGAVLKLHTRPDPANVEVIARHRIRTVVMYRDLRDQCVSRYFHVLADPDHRHHELYAAASPDEALRHSAGVSLTEYRDWIAGWRPLLASQPERFHPVRYEDLRARPGEVLQGVLAFYDLPADRAGAERMVAAVASRTRFGLRTSDLRHGRSTAREARVGAWRERLPADVVERFADEAGELLVELGYEVASAASADRRVIP